ncbi:MAG: hypothetical protein KDA61_12320, partial [Planctomycetales bacterium]|nr:hypothetical protein [Planctomycetales bacterium]
MVRATDGDSTWGARLRRHRWYGVAMLCYMSASCATWPHSANVGRQQWRIDRGPVVPHDTFPRDCSLCHEGGAWDRIRKDFQFDHARETGVRLVGAHDGAQCLRCHNDRGPAGLFAKRGCAGCHEDVHRGQLGKACAQCHNEITWVPEGQVVLHNKTRFPLVGAHTAVACFRCHPGAQVGNFSRAPVLCEACHASDLARATTPDHALQGWVNGCERCHQPLAWDGAGFDHTRFPLTGSHTTVDCAACHAGNVFSGLPHDCGSCHLDDYQATSSPNHTTSGFPTTCENCHNTIAWTGGGFNHIGITSGCADCHAPDYQMAQNPNHAANNFSMSCEQCHNTTSWHGATFNHAGITTGCVQCHTTDYQTAQDPDHAANNFPMSCEQCHSTAS